MSRLDQNYISDAKAIIRVPTSIIFAKVLGILTAPDWKLWFYLANRMPVFASDPRRIPVADALKFLGPGATVKTINDSLSRLGDVFIEIHYEEVTGEQRSVLTHLIDSQKSMAQAGILYFDFDLIIREQMRMPGQYGRLHLDVVRRLTTLGGVKLYAALCARQHATRHNTWTVPLKDDAPGGIGLIDFFGCAVDVRPDNFLTRTVKPAVADLKATGAFGAVTFKTERPTSGKGRPITWIEFVAGHGDGYVKRQYVDCRHEDVFAK